MANPYQEACLQFQKTDVPANYEAYHQFLHDLSELGIPLSQANAYGKYGILPTPCVVFSANAYRVPLNYLTDMFDSNAIWTPCWSPTIERMVQLGAMLPQWTPRTGSISGYECVVVLAQALTGLSYLPERSSKSRSVMPSREVADIW